MLVASGCFAILILHGKEVITLKVRNYEVGKLIGEASKFRIYLGNDDDKQVVMKVAKTFEDGDSLAQEASWFNVLRAFIAQVTEMQEKSGEASSHYEWLFANLLSSFLEPSQKDRRINIFEVADTDFGQLIPLPKLRTKTEVDARTSVWILGRLLKIYSFYELLAVSGDNPVIRYANFSPGDYLIGPERHRLIYYNHSGAMADVVATNCVKAIAQFISEWVVIENDPAEQEYYQLLEDFATNGRVTCEEAHAELYQLIGELWGIQYHPFTYRDQDTSRWKTMNEEE